MVNETGVVQTVGFLQQEGTKPTQESVRAQSQDQAATSPEQEPTKLPGWLDTQDTCVEPLGSWKLSFRSSIQAQVLSSSDGLVLSANVPCLFLPSCLLRPWRQKQRGPESDLLAPYQGFLHHLSLQAQGGVLGSPHKDAGLPGGCVAPLQPEDTHWPFLLTLSLGPAAPSSQPVFPPAH